MCNSYFSCKASPSTSCSLSHRWDPGQSTPKKYISYFCLWLTTLLTLYRSYLLSYHVGIKKADISMYTNTHPYRKGSMSKTDRQAKKNFSDVCLYHISSRLFKKTLQVYSTKKSTLCQSDVMDHVVGRVVVQEMMLRRNGNFSAAHHNRDTVWVCVNSMMPSQTSHWVRSHTHL